MKLVRVGQKIPKEILKQAKAEYREAKKHPVVYDEDSPESTPEALAEFAAMAREIRRNSGDVKPVIALRIDPETLAKFKSLGKGYTGVMADVLNRAANNPEIFAKTR
jgi:uncharacterized protein (DUF4415 family)